MDNAAWLDAAIQYIEDNLDRAVTLREVAGAVGYSPFHFHRLFVAMTGQTLAAYIRRRRLVESARLLTETERQMIDVAADFQYSSQESFTRAFRRQFGFTPGEYRRWSGLAWPAVIPLRPTVRGGTVMEPRIVKKGAMTLVGMIYFGDNQNGEVSQLWVEFNEQADQIANYVPDCAFGLSFTDDRESPNFWYMASWAVRELNEVPATMVAKTVPAQTYAVFTHRGPVSNISATYAFAHNNWLPTSGYELAAPFDFEYYDLRFRGPDNPESETDIYIPIRPKA